MKPFFLGLFLSIAGISAAYAEVPTARIINGTVASSTAYPWMVSLRQSANNQQFCGASLIAPSWVMTAAHCVENQQANQLSVVVGDYILNRVDSGEQVRGVKRILTHPERGGFWQVFSGEDYDISLLELDSPVDNAVVLRANESMTSTLATGTPLTVMGWGNRSTTGQSFPSQLYEVQVPLVSQAQCVQDYGSAISDNMLCAGLRQGGKDSCQGDSGGPLVHQRDGQWYQVGIVSWGAGCAQPNRPGVYARVATFTDWINQVVPKVILPPVIDPIVPPVIDIPEIETPEIELEEVVPTPELTDPETTPEEDTTIFNMFGLPSWFSFFSFDGKATQSTFKFENTTDAPVSVVSVSSDSPLVTVLFNTCQYTVESNTSCNIGFQYTPTAYRKLDKGTLSLMISDGSQVGIEIYGEHLTGITGTSNSESAWYASEGEWQVNADENAYVLETWNIATGDGSYLEAEFEGPGLLEFDFTLSNEAEENRMAYSVDGETVRTITGSGRSDVQHATELSEGTHRIRWGFQKQVDSSGQARVENISFTPRLSSDIPTSQSEISVGASGPMTLLGMLNVFIFIASRRRQSTVQKS